MSRSMRRSNQRRQFRFPSRRARVILLAACALPCASGTGALAADQVSTWDDSSNVWSDAAHWSTADFPNNGNGGFTYDAIINGGTVTLDLDVTIEAFTLDGGTLTAAPATNFTLTLNGPFTWTAGTLGGPGAVNAETAITLSGPASKILGNAANTGRTLVNGGIATLEGGNLLISSSGGANPGSILLNTGTFNATGEADISHNNFGGAAGAFVNAGTFNKSGAGTTTSVGARFDTTGTVNVDGGMLQFTGGGSSAGGTFAVNAGSTLAFASGTYSIDNASEIAGDGDVTFVNATITIDGTYAITGVTTISNGTVNFNAPSTTLTTLNMSGGTLAGTGSQNVTDAFNWTGGTLGGPGTTTTDSAAILTLSGPASKILGNAGNTGRTLVNGGIATLEDGNLLISSSGGANPGSTFQNTGTFNATGEADISHNNFGGTAGAFVNAGNFNKSGAGTTTNIGARFESAGTVNVNEGTLQFSGGGSSAGGTFAVDAGSTLAFASGTYSIDSASEIAGDGDISFTNATVTIDGNYAITGVTTITGGTVNLNTPAATLTTLNMSGGTLAGTGSQNVTDDFNWTGGTLGGAATTTVDPTAALTLGGSASKVLGNAANTGRTLVNGGIATLEGGNLLISSSGGANPGSIFQNTGTFNATGEADISHNNFGGSAGSFVNAGTFNKSGAGTTTNVSVSFDNSGVISVPGGTTLSFTGGYAQSAGRLILDGGTIEGSSALNIAGGTIEGNGTIAQAVNNTAGTISPGPSADTLTIDNRLTLGDQARLLIELGGTTQGSSYDFIDVNNASGNVILDGDLLLFMIDGYESAADAADVLTVLTANSDLLGAFDNVASGGALLTADGLATFTVHYGAGSSFGANSVVLTDFAAIPEPTCVGLLGLAMLGIRRRRRRSESGAA